MFENPLDKLRDTAAEASSRSDLWVTFINQAKVKNFAEIGVWRGQFAEIINNPWRQKQVDQMRAINQRRRAQAEIK